MEQREWTQRGDPACPLLWSVIQEGVSILAAPWEQGPAQCPSLASSPFYLCTDPPQSSSRPRTAAHQGGDKRHEAQPRASCTLTLIPVSFGMAGCPPEPSLLQWKPLPCHSPSCRTIPSLHDTGSCCPTKATHWRPLAPALPHSRPSIANKSSAAAPWVAAPTRCTHWGPHLQAPHQYHRSLATSSQPILGASWLLLHR